jgi:hypothetical protein
VLIKFKANPLGIPDGGIGILVPGLGLTPQALNSALAALAPKG